MRPSDDDFLVPEARLTELAGILATGVLRLHSRGMLARSSIAIAPPENSDDSRSPRLEVPDDTVLSVHTG